jgi:hypothetical protein
LLRPSILWSRAKTLDLSRRSGRFRILADKDCESVSPLSGKGLSYGSRTEAYSVEARLFGKPRLKRLRGIHPHSCDKTIHSSKEPGLLYSLGSSLFLKSWLGWRQYSFQADPPGLSPMETPMMSHPPEQASETDMAYWLNRVATLEVLICELLAKNQRLRSVLELTTQDHPASSVIAQRLGN